MNKDSRPLVPLSHDLELRPREATSVSMRRMLAPLLEQCLRDITESIARLRQLADQAGQQENASAEAALRAKIADQAMALLRLCREEPPTTPREIRSQRDLPDLSKLSPETRRRLDEVMEVADNELGPEWHEYRG